MTLSLHVGRHRAKDKSIHVVPGSDEDMNLVHLTEQGWKDALQDGKSGALILPKKDIIRIQKSPFMRVTETATARLNGAGYDHANGDVVSFGTSADLGFSPVSFPDEVMGVYDQPNFLDVLFRNHFVPTGTHDDKPIANMAQFMYGTLAAIADGYESLKREIKRGADAHLGIECHSDIIDACLAGLIGSVVPNEDGSSVTFGKKYHGTEGSIKDSEFITGSMAPLTLSGTLDNPTFSVYLRGRPHEVTLDKIKQTRDMAAGYAGK